MKKFLLSFATAILSTLPLMADINTMNYQAIINEADGKPAAEKNIGVRFAIVSGDATLMSEETVLKSDAAGMVQYQIGSSSDNGLSAIDWTAKDIMLQVGIDLNGGTDYTSVYSSTIQSVPTAMYAERSGESAELRNMIYDVMAKTDANIAMLQVMIDEIEYRYASREDLDEVRYMLEGMMKEQQMMTNDIITALEAEIKETNYKFEDLENYLHKSEERLRALEEAVGDLLNR